MNPKKTSADRETLEEEPDFRSTRKTRDPQASQDGSRAWNRRKKPTDHEPNEDDETAQGKLTFEEMLARELEASKEKTRDTGGKTHPGDPSGNRKTPAPRKNHDKLPRPR